MPRATILLVDDDEDVLFGLGHALRGQGYELRFAVGPEAALELLSTDPVDVVVSDYLMPGMNGLELLTLVRQRHPDAARIMLTGHADTSVAVEAINSGQIYKFLQKPCDRVELQVAVQLAWEQVSRQRGERRLLELLSSHPELQAQLQKAPASPVSAWMRR